MKKLDFKELYILNVVGQIDVYQDSATGDLYLNMTKFFEALGQQPGPPPAQGLSNLILTPAPESVDLEVTTDVGNGFIYAVFLPAGAVAPSAQQIEAGTDAAGQPAALADAIEITSVDNVFDIGPNLAANTTYDLYVVHKREDLTFSNILSGTVTTLAGA